MAEPAVYHNIAMHRLKKDEDLSLGSLPLELVSHIGSFLSKPGKTMATHKHTHTHTHTHTQTHTHTHTYTHTYTHTHTLTHTHTDTHTHKIGRAHV